MTDSTRMSDATIMFHIVRAHNGISATELERQSVVWGISQRSVASRRVTLILGGFIYTLDNGATFHATPSGKLLPFGTEIVVDHEDKERLQINGAGGPVIGRRNVLGMLSQLFRDAEEAARHGDVEELAE